MANDKLNTELSISTKVLVIGTGLVACTAARELAETGYRVLFCSPQSDIPGNPRSFASVHGHVFDLEAMITEIKEDNRIEIMAPAEILELEGSPGEFRVRLKTVNRTSLLKEVGAVILAHEPVLKTDFESWGVNELKTVRSLSWIESHLTSSVDDAFLSWKESLKVIFICGFTHHSNPFTQKRAIEAALQLASNKENQVFFITEHYKVADSDMERLTRKARDAGVLFVKITGKRPKLESNGDHLKVTYYDEDLGEDVSISPNLVILEESCRPSREFPLLAGTIGINLDQRGFFQCENIYNRPIYTNRVGVWVVGSGKGPVSFREAMDEAKAAVLDVHRFLEQGKRLIHVKRIELDTKKCTICLTCYRLCPHRAISYRNRRPVFSNLACKACGICASECPMDAIQINDFTDHQIRSQVLEIISAGSNGAGEDVPLLVAFCCQNSAFEAADLANFRGLPWPKGLRLVKVPCAGRIDPDFLLTAFKAGADGVLVLGCHPESCKSIMGNDFAEWRVESIKAYLSECGLEEERLSFGTLAPSMSSEFVKMAKEMEKTILEIGKSPVQKPIHAV